MLCAQIPSKPLLKVRVTHSTIRNWLPLHMAEERSLLYLATLEVFGPVGEAGHGTPLVGNEADPVLICGTHELVITLFYSPP